MRNTMTEYEYAQAVMKAAGVPAGHWKMHQTQVAFHDDYPDPLTSGDDFLALWDALVAKGYVVRITVYPTRMTCVRMFSHVEDTFTAGEADDADRRVALVEAAGQALGVSRAA